MKDAIRRGIEECGIVDAFARLIEAITKDGSLPDGLLARIEVLEEHARRSTVAHERLLEAITSIHDQLANLVDLARTHDTRLERHRLRIRWLETLVHLFHGWRPNPRL